MDVMFVAAHMAASTSLSLIRPKAMLTSIALRFTRRLTSNGPLVGLESVSGH